MNNITFTDTHQIALLALTKTVMATEKTEFIMTCDSLLHNGIIFIDENDLPITSVPRAIAQTAISFYGYNNETFNRTLIESFATVANMSRDEFYLTQILHYLTTYGTNFTTPFVVGERTFTPEETKALKITIIRAESASRSLERINELFATTVAPKAQNIHYYRTLAPFTTIAPEEVKSRELMIIMCAERDIKPSDPEMLFRYLVYCATKETLIIKNKSLIGMIKHAARNNIELINSLTENEMKALASIFYRYKPLFLAFKTPETASVINKIRRLAVKYHKPQSVNTIKNFVNLSSEEQTAIIARATNRELIKLYNALAVPEGTRLFQIRNGKIWVREEEKEGKVSIGLFDKICAASAIGIELHKRLKNYRGMTVYIPRGISYAVPYSEKQFSGAIPWGTAINATDEENAFTIGVHWVNDPDESGCDLDLHGHTPTRHFGWNSDYISEDGEIIYSGDMTNAPAPKGAAESFYINNVNEPVILTLNAFRAKSNKQFQFFMTKGEDDEMRERATFDASKLISAPLPLAFADKSSLSLGIFDNKTFYIYGGNVAEGAVPSRDYPKFIEALLNRMTSTYRFESFAAALKINIVHEAPKDTPFLDLSPEALTVNTLLDFVDGNLDKLQFSTIA